MNTFYKVEKKDIKDAEDRMQLSIPSELKDFYLSTGYGFLDSKLSNFNRIMDPQSVASFRLHEDEYEYLESMDIYDSYSDNQLVFFEVSEGLYLSIELTTKNKQRIFLADKELFSSFAEFIEKYQANEEIICSE